MDKFKKIAFDCRLAVLDMIYKAKAGHIGGSMSAMEVLVSLYFGVMDMEKDRFILSKGHIAEALYAVLAHRGIISHEELAAFGAFDSALAGHPTNGVNGVEFATGALGHGLAVGVGMALGLSSKVYVLMGDGELAEGSNWEAMMAAAKYKLSNLIGIVDRNKLQISGETESVMPLEDLGAKFRAFGWEVNEVNGHEPHAIIEALKQPQTKPRVLIANTIKGYGAKIMENNPIWHHHIPDEAQYYEIKESFVKRRNQYE